MPNVRKLTEEEVQTIERKGENKRDQVARLYDEMVADLRTGEYVEISLDAGDTKPTVRHRFNAAALRAGVELDWMRGQADTLKFYVKHSPFETIDERADQQEAEESAMLDHDEENDTAEALAEYEAPATEPDPVVEVAAPKKPRSKKPVTDRQPFVEAP